MTHPIDNANQSTSDKQHQMYSSVLASAVEEYPMLALIRSTDEERARRMVLLLALPDIVDGFSSCLVHFACLSEYSLNDAFSRAMHLSLIEIERALEATLSGDYIVLSNSCRFIMELYMLMTEWTFDPSKMEEWTEIDESKRSKKFGFGVVLNRISHRLGADDDHIRREKVEYQYHSGWLHPTPADPSEMPSEFDRAIDEVIGHVDRLMRTTCNLLVEQPSAIEISPAIKNDNPSWTPVGVPIAWEKAVEWRAARRNQFEQLLRANGLELNNSPVLPKSWTAHDIIRPLHDEQLSPPEREN